MDFNDDGQKICNTCQGYKLTDKKVIRLLEVCPECKGAGNIDWVEYVMGRPQQRSQQVEYYAAQRNIQMLIQMIKDEGRRCGQEIMVEIKHIPYEEIYRGMPHPIIRSKY